MPRYEFHIYEISLKKVHSIDADSSHEALQEFQQSVVLQQQHIAKGQTEYANDIEGFLVEMLDENGQKTGTLSFRRNLLRKRCDQGTSTHPK